MPRQVDPSRAIVPAQSNKLAGRGSGGGRPRIEITAADIAQIEAYARVGLSLEEIAVMLRIGRATFHRWRSIPEVLDAVEAGRADGLDQVGQALFKLATEGNLAACIWLERTRGNRSPEIKVVGELQSEQISARLKTLPIEHLRRIAEGESPHEVLGLAY